MQALRVPTMLLLSSVFLLRNDFIIVATALAAVGAGILFGGMRINPPYDISVRVPVVSDTGAAQTKYIFLFLHWYGKQADTDGQCMVHALHHFIRQLSDIPCQAALVKRPDLL